MKYCPSCGSDISMYLRAEGSRLPQIEATPLSVASTQPASFIYNQTAIWTELVTRAKAASSPSSPGDLVDDAVKKYLHLPRGTDGVNHETIIHMVFDKPIVPRGGLLHQAMRSDGRSHPTSTAELEAMGYLVTNDKIVEINGIPVSAAYGAVSYWGGEKQFRRWHLSGPVQINPSRNGNPLFMDEEMIAFSATWHDLNKMRDAMFALCTTFIEGIDGKPIATPVALEITPR